MSPPASGSAAQVQRLSRAAVAKVNEVMQDPETRDRVLENGRTLLDLAQQWRDERRRRTSERDGPGISERLKSRTSQRFGVGRLKARVDRLGEALDTLGARSPELVEELGAMRSQVRDVELRLPVAEALSGRPRRRMLKAFDRRLDALEGTLADALLPSSDDQG
ncbi:hypothetical protein [Salsipaludibacter albus]|uniref:hypothetical protein n=1 Tax=Salsipaludibacter albus TaxID=2849650 RepID=UPI001EE40E0C|nr:hypothetical protein [Salsipaludibacter albus]MBY5162105.1 hypothetical protein [Salsipaludibacter albus]